MSRVLLVLPSSTYRASDFLHAARRLDVEVLVASEGAQALAGEMGDRFLQVDLDDPEGAARDIAGLAERRPLDAVLAVDDRGVIAASLAARRLGLPHNPPEAAAATRHKGAMRQILETAGIRQPAFRVVGPDEDAARAAQEVGLPCVVKPVSLQAGRGVIRADRPEEAARAAARVRGILADAGADPGEPLLVERFVPGPEVALEGLLDCGQLEILALLDKPEPMDGPYFEETILVTPSRLPEALQEAVRRETARAARALGLREGPVHAELRVGDGPVVLELAARSIGGLCSRALHFGLLETTLETIILRQALGMPVGDLGRPPYASGVLMLPIPRPGALAGVGGVEEARAVPGITEVEITVAPGTAVRPLPEGDRYLGFVFARGRTPEEAERSLRRAWSLLEIEIDPA